MSIKTIFVQPGGGYEKVVVGSREASTTERDEITVRLHANSLNYHDFAVVSGMWGPNSKLVTRS
jgi:NADPH:quinone reductase-like Zn-dependent oxidoreductase